MILIGCGGHAKNLDSKHVTAYYDPNPCDWINKPRLMKMTYPCSLLMGYVGLTCEALEKRYEQMMEYKSKGAMFPQYIVDSATINGDISITGTQVLSDAFINSGAKIGDGAVINTGAIIEHDAIVERGCHVAPGAIVLGGAKVGEFSFIGANATVIQCAIVPPRTFVKAGTVFTGCGEVRGPGVKENLATLLHGG